MTILEHKSINRILFILESEPKTGHIGIAEHVNLLSKRLDTIEVNQKALQKRNQIVYSAYLAVFGFITFIVGKSWSYILKLI